MSIPYLTVEMHLRDVQADDIERVLRVLHEMGGVYVVIERPESVAVPMPPDVPDPAPLPPHEPPVPEPPPLPWWASLRVNDVVNIARDSVPVRHAPTDVGAIWKTVGLTWGDMHIAANPDGTPGLLAIAGTEDAWLKVNPDPVQLWVKASDVRRGTG